MIEYQVEVRGFVRVGIHRWQQGLRNRLDFLPAEQATVVNL